MELPATRLDQDELDLIARGKVPAELAVIQLLLHAKFMADEVERVSEQRDAYRDNAMCIPKPRHPHPLDAAINNVHGLITVVQAGRSAVSPIAIAQFGRSAVTPITVSDLDNAVEALRGVRDTLRNIKEHPFDYLNGLGYTLGPASVTVRASAGRPEPDRDGVRSSDL